MSEFNERSHVVLVTGASRGIGRAIAVAFGEDGSRVVVNHPGEEEQAAETAVLVAAAGGEPFVVRADVSVSSDVESMVATVLERFGRIDVLVLNHGICPFRSFWEIDEQLWDRVHAVNAKGAFLVAQAVARHMVERGGGGRIIAISSISALAGGSEQVHYCPSKAAVSSLMKSLAIVLGPHRITCNAVLPGQIETDMNRDQMRRRPEVRRALEERTPVGRLGDPRDVADVVRLLASDTTRYVNGAELVVDGGLLVNLQ